MPPIFDCDISPYLLLASSGEKPGVPQNTCDAQDRLPPSPQGRKEENDLVPSASPAEVGKLRHPESGGLEGSDAGVDAGVWGSAGSPQEPALPGPLWCPGYEKPVAEALGDQPVVKGASGIPA